MMIHSWDDPTQKIPPPDALAVESRGDDYWEFVYPRLTMTIYDVFEEAIDAWRVGDVDHAEYRYRRLLDDYPEFIDVYHHLAMLFAETGREDEAFVLWQHAVQIGVECLPDSVRSGVGTLPWFMIDNRPFLRAFHGLSLEILGRGDVEKALEAFLRLLAWNPNDNQGIRVLAIDCYFRLGQPEGVLKICEQFPQDVMPEVLYGHSLALHQLDELDQAREALVVAIANVPLVAHELTRKSHSKPKGLRMDSIVLGSPEQAYLYWKDHGRFWKETPGALDLLHDVLGSLPGQEN
jgi:tetratricopeptide (TPR) repeat protein